MDAVIRAVVVYLLLMIIFRLSGKRALSQTTTFDLVLTLIISESIQQALLDNDRSITHAILVVIGLIGFDILVSLAKQHSPAFARLVEGSPVVLIEEGRVHTNYMDKERVDENDLLHAIRSKHGLARLDQVAYAVVERSGEITVIPSRDVQRP